MTGNREDLLTVVNFLNNDPLKLTALETLLGRSLLADFYVNAKKQEWDNLRFDLSRLLAPEVSVPREWAPDIRAREKKWMQREMPYVGLRGLVASLNKHVEKPTWTLEKTGKAFAKIDISGFNGSLIKQEFPQKPWGEIARLLESGEVFKIRQCLVCQIFFLKNRDWQQCCLKPACKKRFYSWRSSDRKARRRQIDTADAIKRQRAIQEKRDLVRLEKLLRDSKVIRAFPGGPTQRLKTSERILGFVNESHSIDEVFKRCSSSEERVLCKYLHGGY